MLNPWFERPWFQSKKDERLIALEYNVKKAVYRGFKQYVQRVTCELSVRQRPLENRIGEITERIGILALIWAFLCFVQARCSRMCHVAVPGFYVCYTLAR